MMGKKLWTQYKSNRELGESLRAYWLDIKIIFL